MIPLSTHNVPWYKRASDTGYLNSNNEWVEDTFLAVDTLTCNIQPFSQGKNKIILPDGVRADSAIVLRTKSVLQCADDQLGLDGDEIEYKGFRYEVFYEEDFTGYGLITDHLKYLLKRKDKV